MDFKDEQSIKWLESVENSIGYKFREPILIAEALTHSSYGWTDEDDVRIDNEKLEFIGDGYLDAIVGSRIYEEMSNDTKEGDLTKARAQIVCESSLATIGRSLNLGEFLRLGPGEEKTGGRDKDSLIADAVESVIGAIYLDGGYDAASKFVLDKFQGLINDALSGRLITDFKTELQERVHRAGGTIKYTVERTEGPDHEKVFYINLEINDKIVSSGVGKSKKEAQQRAAKIIMEKGIENVL